MAIPAVIKNNFHTQEQAFRNGDIALVCQSQPIKMAWSPLRLL